jgi:2-polyprenyl-3-methyl-5-hydroxy-6-metoxy-1,4-benzoquinol methylase
MDYPEYLRQMAETYEIAPTELYVEEKAGFTGYDTWAQTYDLETTNPVILGEEEALGYLPQNYPAKTVLDVGAGSGRHAIPYASAGARVTALEPSHQMLNAAKSKAATEGLDIEFHQIDIRSWTKDDRVFDVVVCCLVLSHIENLVTTTRDLVRRVGSNGHLIITDFHPHNLLAGMRTSFVHGETKFYIPNFIHLPSVYVKLTSEEGMNLVEFHETGHIDGYPQMPATISVVFRRDGS